MFCVLYNSDHDQAREEADEAEVMSVYGRTHEKPRFAITVGW
jgi:hypothetical protein